MRSTTPDLNTPTIIQLLRCERGIHFRTKKDAIFLFNLLED